MDESPTIEAPSIPQAASAVDVGVVEWENGRTPIKSEENRVGSGAEEGLATLSEECKQNRCPRILFLDHTAAIGGGEIALLNLVRRLDQTRYAPVVLLCSEGPLVERLRAAAIETHVLPLSARVAEARKDQLGGRSLLRVAEVAATLRYVVRLARFIRTLDVDLVHTNSLKADVIGGLAARLARTPVIWHVRDRIDEDYLPRSAVRLFRWMARILPDYVIANSRSTLQTLHLPSNAGSDAVASGLDLDNASRAESANDGGIAGSSAPHSESLHAVVGLVGRITRWKGQHVFIEAAAMVRKRFPQARFQIAGAALFGETQYGQEIHELAEQLKVKDVVEFMGFREDVPRLIAELDVLVHASITGEPFGQVVIEGMVAGKPVVATNGGGVPEIVDDGVTGILVPMNDAKAMAAAICELLADPEKSRQMGQRGRQRVLEHFTIEQTARKVERIYDDLLRIRRHPNAMRLKTDDKREGQR